MRVLAHPSRENRSHYFVRRGSLAIAACRQDGPKEGDISGGERWTVRDLQDGDVMCFYCQKRASQKPPLKAPLPCKHPTRKVELLRSPSSTVAVHVANDSGASLCGQVKAGLSSRLGEWYQESGRGASVTCSRCSKAAGLHPQSFAPRRKQNSEYEKWQAWTGKAYKKKSAKHGA